jgi:diaminohydroxyphosphoribosylaminopyrimidine deaminase/5-amino-6-(5-phosphoribosylamino)uracil reductase
MTNVLVEGGSQLFGSLFDAGAIDEVHIFIAPILAGGSGAPSPIAGEGIDKIASAMNLTDFQVIHSGEDLHVHGFVRKTDSPPVALGFL